MGMFHQFHSESITSFVEKLELGIDILNFTDGPETPVPKTDVYLYENKLFLTYQQCIEMTKAREHV